MEARKISDREVIKKKLWNRNFSLLWLGQLVSNFGDAFYNIALSIMVLDMTGSVAFLAYLPYKTHKKQ